MILVGIWLLFACGLGLVIHLFGQTDQTQKADAIVVLGAGLRRDNTPGPALTRRSNRAADLWEQGFAPVIICTGGMTGRATRSEADACKEILLQRGVPASVVLLEENSRSTEENALYTHEIFLERGWSMVLLVSDSFHMLRAKWIFEGEGFTVYTSPVALGVVRFDEYVLFTAREVGAFHWLFVKRLLNLPYTYVGGL
jgi:uncharacterized SAM-binding protein YcdF (DUF218 family)